MRCPRSSVIVVSLVLAVGPGCNRRVFRYVDNACDSTTPVQVIVPEQKPADILIVVDNSGSMQEEQDELAANFFNLNIAADPENPDVGAGECPLGDLRHIPARYQNPAPVLYEGDGPLSRCGFIQLLAAYENDFRVGVITTDVGQCDNRFGQAPSDWGFRPQRGCLQPDGPTRAGHDLVIARADLEDGDDGNDDFAARFDRTLQNIRTFGSAFERGLDAMAIFLDADGERAPECADDLARFRRPGAQLVVILLTDEEDCSHADGALGFLDENDGVACAANEGQAPRDIADRCYSEPEKLAPVSRYVEALRAADPGAKVAVIAGLVPDGIDQDGVDPAGADAELRASGCLAASSGDAAPSDACWESHGSSALRSPGQVCSDSPLPEIAAARQGRPCCAADAGSRHLELARSFTTDAQARSLVDSICNASYRDTMLAVAAFIAAPTSVLLAEPPADDLIVVTVRRAGQREAEVVPRIDAAACASTAGWYLAGPREVIFCAEALPGPGDEVEVLAKGLSESAACLEAAGGEEGQDAG